jgi:hypothetical protein
MEHMFIGLHITLASNVESIVAHGFKIPTTKRCNPWLGTGVYFWDNDLAAGKRWAEKRGLESYVIFKVQIRVSEEKLLDLAPHEAREQLHTSATELATQRSLELLDNSIGEAIDLVCAYSDNAYDVVRGVFPGQPGPILFTKPQPPVDVKIILAVRNLACITNSTIIFRSSDYYCSFAKLG